MTLEPPPPKVLLAILDLPSTLSVSFSSLMETLMPYLSRLVQSWSCPCPSFTYNSKILSRVSLRLITSANSLKQLQSLNRCLSYHQCTEPWGWSGRLAWTWISRWWRVSRNRVIGTISRGTVIRWRLLLITIHIQLHNLRVYSSLFHIYSWITDKFTCVLH